MGEGLSYNPEPQIEGPWEYDENHGVVLGEPLEGQVKPKEKTKVERKEGVYTELEDKRIEQLNNQGPKANMGM